MAAWKWARIFRKALSAKNPNNGGSHIDYIELGKPLNKTGSFGMNLSISIGCPNSNTPRRL
jgi:hypothetical protein